MGQEEEKELRRRVFPPYQLNKDLVSLAKDDVIVMHCLPAHRGEEITDDVMDGEHSVVLIKQKTDYTYKKLSWLCLFDAF